MAQDEGYKYAQIDLSGCWGGNELEIIPRATTAGENYKVPSGQGVPSNGDFYTSNSYNLGSGSSNVGAGQNYVRVYSTDNFLKNVVKPRNHGSYSGISCEIAYHDNERAYICASNCIFQQSQPGNPSWGNVTYTGLQVSKPEETTNRWRSIPQGGVIKHGETHDFRCNYSNNLYPEMGTPLIETRKCMYGALSAPIPDSDSQSIYKM